MDATSQTEQPQDTSPSLWGRLKRWMRPKHEKKWSRAFIINLVSGVFLAFVVFFEVLKNTWHLGVDPQIVRCLPWKYYLLEQKQPHAIVKNRIYRYTAHQMPTVPNGTPMVKYVAAVAGDKVMVDKSGVHINGKKWGDLNIATMNKAKLKLSDVVASYTVQDGQVLMLGILPSSFDGRYHGTVAVSSIQGRAIPLW